MRALEQVVDDGTADTCPSCARVPLFGGLGELVTPCVRHRAPRRRGRPRVPKPAPVPSPYKWFLPHHGEPTAKCGTFTYWAHRAGPVYHGERRFHDCQRYECPTCRSKLNDDNTVERAAGWEDREAWAITERIELARARGYERGKPIHVVWSPEPMVARLWAAHDVGYERLRKDAYKMLRSIGMRGGALVFHRERIPSRFNKWGKLTRCADGPHFHALGFGWIDYDGVDALYKETGGVVVNKGVRNSVRRTALYLLSHASRARVATARVGDAPDNATYAEFDTLAVTWFGSLAYNKMPVQQEELDGEKTRRCGICDKDINVDEWCQVELPFGEPPPSTDWFWVDPTKWRRVLLETESWGAGPLWRDAAYASRTSSAADVLE